MGLQTKRHHPLFLGTLIRQLIRLTASKIVLETQLYHERTHGSPSNYNWQQVLGRYNVYLRGM